MKTMKNRCFNAKCFYTNGGDTGLHNNLKLVSYRIFCIMVWGSIVISLVVGLWTIIKSL